MRGFIFIADKRPAAMNIVMDCQCKWIFITDLSIVAGITLLLQCQMDCIWCTWVHKAVFIFPFFLLFEPFMAI